jgi:predicted Rossmann fold flavoprotein
MEDPIIVAGAGGAGLIAAWKAAVSGVPVLLLERNPRIGVKILISGGGKCNVTHSGTVDELLDAFSEREKRFLKHALYRFSNTDFLELMSREGIATSVRPNGRVFPASESAKDVVRALESLLKRTGVTLLLNSRVDEILADGNAVLGVRVNSRVLSTKHLVLATGGVSYPKTGTTGDGYTWAAALGHTIVPLRSALAPMSVSPSLPREWQGISIRDCRLFAVSDNKRRSSWEGDLLFTHEGVSGPAALELSRSVALARESGAVDLYVDFFPQKDFEALDELLLGLVQSNRNRSIGTVLDAWMPNRLVEPFLAGIGVDAQTRGHVLSRQDRRALVRVLKEWRIGTVSAISIGRGEVTAGGVALGEVNPRTMRSKIVHGLYLCGEVLDIAGPIGGYNLQAAFSTGYLAGEHAAMDWKKEGDTAERRVAPEN